MLTPELIRSLDIPGPRYTSYPTAPEWSAEYTGQSYLNAINAWRQNPVPISLYVHIPFCKSMCFYCGCNVSIRKSNANVGFEYIEYLKKELELSWQGGGVRPEVKQLHLGGGTPNFLSCDELRELKRLIDRYFEIASDAEVAIEVDPRSVSKEQLFLLKELGFNRVSMGIQDFSADVQSVINRIQPYSLVTTVFEWIRSAGFESINVDLIYGLPNQTVANFQETTRQIIELNPDRIALYSYAHVPWLKSHQKLIKETALPKSDEKLSIFLGARNEFLSSGYVAIGMDHFAKATDELSVAYDNGYLYRNFMGYTVKPADDFVGIGVSSIGYISGNFVQNVKELKTYYSMLDANILPVDRGLRLSSDDHIRQWVIVSLMCQFKLEKTEFHQRFNLDFDVYFKDVVPHLNRCEEQRLVLLSLDQIKITDLGRLFVRNVVMGFDAYLNKSSERQFSRTV